jgi:hypothetical protein
MTDLFNPDNNELKRATVKRRVDAIRISEPLPDPRYRILNLGAGVQSCALALMSSRGELELLDFAYFADTGWESRQTYAYLDWLEPQLRFPVVRLKRAGPNLGDFLIESTKRPQQGRQTAPFFVKAPDGMLAKQCSKEWKTRVVQLALRQLLGLGHRQHGPSEPVIEQWLGMTTDELQRVGTSEKRYLHHRYPLIELRMAKRDLYPWYEQRQLPVPPKSSCIFCPLQLPSRIRTTLQDPVDGPRLVQFDRAIRPGFAGMEGEAFLTRERRPIDQCDLRTAEEAGQESFGDFCGDGECGV